MTPEERLAQARESARHYKARCQRLAALIRDQRALREASDALAEATIALPDVVKTAALQRALSAWRRAKNEQEASDGV